VTKGVGKLTPFPQTRIDMLTLEQKIEMNQEIRRQNDLGFPEKAQKIRAALNADEFYMGEAAQVAVSMDEPALNARKAEWQEYARLASDFDDDVIDNATRSDLIGMLRAHGIIE